MIYQKFQKTNLFFANAVALVLVSVSMILFYLRRVPLNSFTDYLSFFTYYLLIVVSSNLINHYLIQNKIVAVNNYLPQLLALLILLHANYSIQNLKILLGLTLVITFIYRALNLHNVRGAFLKLFSLGLIMGLVLLVLPIFVPYVVLAFVSIAWIKTTTIKDFFSLLIGILYPIFLRYVYHFFMEGDLRWFSDELLNYAMPSISVSLWKTESLILLFIFSMMLFSMFKYLSKLSVLSVRLRVHQRIWYLYVLLGVLCLWLPTSYSSISSLMLVLAFPASVFLVQYFEEIKNKKWLDFLLLLMLFSSFTYNYLISN